MEFNYFKTSVMSVMAVGALAFSASVMAASPASVLPKEGPVPRLESISLVFNSGAEVAWDVDSDRVPCVYSEGSAEPFTLAGTTSLVAEDNVLTYNLSREAVAEGTYKVVFPAGSYKVNGEAGEACEYTYNVTGAEAGGYTVSPDASVVSEIRAVVITFPAAKEVTVLTQEDGLNSENAPRLYLLTEDGESARDMMVPSANFNNLVLNTMYVAVTEPGNYVLRVPGACYFVDGKPGQDITLNYTIAEDPYPNVTVTIDPAEGEVDELDSLTITFDGVDGVEWSVSGTENSPYIADMIGNRVGTFTNLSDNANTLTLAMYNSPFDVKGVYQVIIPEGSYKFTGETVIPGKKLVFDYDVVGVSGVVIEPAVNVLSEIQNFKITFNDAKEVTLAEELGTENTPLLFIVNEEGERERRGTFFPEIVGGNNMLLTMRSPIYEPGEYVVVVPGTCYFIDGKAGEDLSFSYTVVEPTYPDVDLSVNPAANIVESIETIELTFGGVEIVEWAVTGTENSPYMVDEAGNRVATFSKLGGQGNMLSFGLPSEAYDVKGNYTVIIPEGSYVFQGIYHGMPGKELSLNFEILGIDGYTVDPAVNVLSEIQNIKITFNGAKEVTLAEELGTENTPVLYLVNEEGERERRGTFFPEVVGGNNMLLTMRSPIYEPGEYVVVVPGTCYFVDGEAGEDIELSYTVVEPTYPDVDLSVNPAANIVESIETIEVTFGGVDVVEWAVTGTENSPYMVDEAGNRAATFSKLGGEGNMLSFGLPSEAYDVKGNYTVIIPEGSYVFQGIYHGMPGREISLNFEILGLDDVSVEPAVNVLNEIQNIKITFNGAKEVTLAEELGTENTPVLYLVNEEGERERRGTFFPEVVGGNNMLLTMRSPIYEPGEYVVVVPGTCYFVDGEAGEDIELSYTVVEPTYPDVDLSVNPAADVVETLDTIEVTFGGVDIVEWAVTGTENAPYMVDEDGNRWATFTELNGLGNMLSMGFKTEFTKKGNYTVIIPEGSYVLQGIYRGMPGKEITLHYEVLGLGGYTVEPAVDKVTEIALIKITFNDAEIITLAEDLGTGKTPYFDIINEEGEREYRGTLFPEVAGNDLFLRVYREPITEPGEYVVVLPADCYFIDGEPGEKIELYYTILETGSELKYTVDPSDYTVKQLDVISITFDDYEEAFWNLPGIRNKEVAYPSVAKGNSEPVELTNLYSNDNILSLSREGYEAFAEPDFYVVTIPAGSYFIDGNDGIEIVLNYIVDPSAVNAIFGDKANMDVFDINGRLILRNADAEAVKSLRGIFVINGKKYILR